MPRGWGHLTRRQKNRIARHINSNVTRPGFEKVINNKIRHCATEGKYYVKKNGKRKGHCRYPPGHAPRRRHRKPRGNTSYGKRVGGHGRSSTLRRFL